ncbi:hypothetical protein [Streptomyces sp. NPDC058812]
MPAPVPSRPVTGIPGTGTVTRVADTVSVAAVPDTGTSPPA